MRKQSLAIISIIAVGSLFSISYAASTIITDTSISTTNLTVTGTCSGCGGEGNFNSYSVITNQTVSNVIGTSMRVILVNNTGSILATDASNNETIIKSNGVVVDAGAENIGNFNQVIQFGQSQTGEYRFMFDSNNNLLLIYKNDHLIQSSSITVSQFTHSNLQDEAIGISPNGKYISIYGQDSGLSLNRFILLEGS